MLKHLWLFVGVIVDRIINVGEVVVVVAVIEVVFEAEWKKSQKTIFWCLSFPLKVTNLKLSRHLFSLVSSYFIYFQTLLKFNPPFAENFRSLVGNRWQSSLHFRQHTRNCQTSLRQKKTILFGKTKFCPEVIEVAQQKSATSNHFNILAFDWEKHL